MGQMSISANSHLSKFNINNKYNFIWQDRGIYSLELMTQQM